MRKFFGLRNEVFQKFTHISCKIPPALGGSDSDLNNLELTLASTNLKILGQIMNQIKALPPGTKILEVRMNASKEEIILVPDIYSRT